MSTSTPYTESLPRLRSDLLLTALLALLSQGCRDLGLNDPPVVGGLTGRIDARPHLPAAGHELRLLDKDGGEARASTDAEGVFVFSNVFPGVYDLVAELPGFVPVVKPKIRITTGGLLDLGPIPLLWQGDTEAVATVRGKVVATGGGAFDGATVSFVLAGTTIAVTPVDAEGLFFQRVPPGDFTLVARHRAFVAGQVQVVISAGEAVDLTPTPIVLGLNPATLTGRVLKEVDGSPSVPAAGAIVTLSTGQTTAAQADGTFSLTDLPEGTLGVAITLPSSHHDPVSSRPVALRAGQTSSLPAVTLALDRGSVTGTVRMADDTPVTGAQVFIVGRAESVGVSPDLTDPSLGRFVIDRVPRGTWEVVATRERYSRASAPITVSADGATLDTGLLTLTLLQGDFEIDDADATSLPGYTHASNLTLSFTRFPSTGVADWRASEDVTFTNVAFLPYTGASQPFTLPAGDGNRTIYAQYRTASGTVSSTFASSIVVDTAAPLIQSLRLSSTGELGTARFTNVSPLIPIALVATEERSGLQAMRLGAALDGLGNVDAPLRTYLAATAFQRVNSVDGPETARAQLVDNAGNASTVTSDTIIVDTTQPTGALNISSSPPALPGFTPREVISVEVSAPAEPFGGALTVRLANQSGLALDSAPLVPFAPQLTHALDPSVDGLKTVYGLFRDTAGNVSLQATAQITLDREPPPVSVSVQQGTVTNQATVALTLAANLADLVPDAGLTLAENDDFAGPSAVGPMAFPVTGTAMFPLSGGEGLKRVSVRVRDRAGNEGRATAFVELDTTPPAAALWVTGTLADGRASSTVTSSPTLQVRLEALGAVEYRLGTESLTCTGTWTPWTTPALTLDLGATTGARVVMACVRDRAGNITGPLTAPMDFDPVAPTGCTSVAAGKRVDGSLAPAGKTARNDVTMTIACAETPTELTLSNTPVTCSPTAPLTWGPFVPSSTFLVNDSVSAIFGCVRDRAGNVTALPNASMLLDRQGPVGVSISLENGAAVLNLATVGGTLAVNAAAPSDAVEWALAATPNPSSFLTLPASRLGALPLPPEGTATVYALFRDELGNLSAEVNDSIVIDLTAPSTGSINSPAANAYVPSVSLPMTLAVPPTATQMQVVAQPVGTPCPTSLFTSAPTQGAASSTTFLLSSGDGPKTVCVRFLDANQNPSTPIGRTVNLDTTPPTQPRIATAPAVVKQADYPLGSTWAVALVASPTETNFDAWEILGGVDGANQPITSWQRVASPLSTLSFTFRLDVDAALAAGLSNRLRLRARDLAGNVSAEDGLEVIVDGSLPPAVTLSQVWVTNASNAASVYWKATPPPVPPGDDVVAYRVYYSQTSLAAGAPKSAYSGTGAVEGPSGFTVTRLPTATQVATLSGLPNASRVFATIAAIDRAGNEGPLPATPSSTFPFVTLWPNALPLTPVARLDLPGVDLDRLVVLDHYAYAAAWTGNAGSFPVSCTSGTPLAAQLQVFDLKGVAPHVRRGAIQDAPAPAGPVVVHSSPPLSGATCVSGGPPRPLVIVADDPHLFLSVGGTVHVFFRGDPTQPTWLGSLDLSANVPAIVDLQVVGNRLFVIGTTSAAAVDLSALFDASPSSLPTWPSSSLGVVTNGSFAATGGALSRNRLVQTNTGGNIVSWQVDAALDNDVGTSWANGSALISSGAGPTNTPQGHRLVSGNWLYVGGIPLKVMSLNRLWSGAAPAFPADLAVDSPMSMTGDFVMSGNALLGISSLDVQAWDVTAPALAQLAQLQSTPTSADRVARFGTFALVGSNSILQVYQLATLRTPRLQSALSGQGLGISLQGAFLHGGLGETFDLQAGSAVPIRQGTSSFTCIYDGAMRDDVKVLAMGNVLRVVRVEPLVDRDGATSFNPTPGGGQVTDLTLGAGVRATGVRWLGEYLVVSEIRPTGAFVEVFDGRALTNPYSGLGVVLPTRGEVQVATFTPTNASWATLNLTGSLAVVALDVPQAAEGTYFADLRGLLAASGGTGVALGRVTTGPTVAAIVQGDALYAATTGGFKVANVAPVRSFTALGSSPSVTLVDTNADQALFASGGALVRAGVVGLSTWDIASPFAPVKLGERFAVSNQTQCGVDGLLQFMRTSLTVSGTSAMHGTYSAMTLYQLE